MPNFHIRPATTEDIPALMRMESGAATASHWSAEQYKAVFSRNSKRNVLVIERPGAICGFVVLHAISQEWEIENLVVAELTRRKGLGMQLLEESLNLACRFGAREIFLEVRESNLAAHALYEKSGFARVGLRRGYYRNPEENAVVYRRNCS